MSFYLSVFLPVCLFAFPTVCLSFNMFVCLFTCVSVFITVCLSNCLPVCLSTFVSVYLPLCLPTCLSCCLPVCLSFYPSCSGVSVCLIVSRTTQMFSLVSTIVQSNLARLQWTVSLTRPPLEFPKHRCIWAIKILGTDIEITVQLYPSPIFRSLLPHLHLLCQWLTDYREDFLNFRSQYFYSAV